MEDVAAGHAVHCSGAVRTPTVSAYVPARQSKAHPSKLTKMDPLACIHLPLGQCQMSATLEKMIALLSRGWSRKLVLVRVTVPALTYKA